jgi:sugar lactone lactonase YvrE
MMIKHRISRNLLVTLVLLLIGLLAIPTVQTLAASTFPELIPLPDGFRPEGIAIGRGTQFFVGSIPTGAIYSGDLRTGEGDLLVQPQEGRAAIGLSYDTRTNNLYVAGGPTGMAFVYDAATGANVAEIELTAPGTFINDAVVTKDAVYFTDSGRQYMYRVALEADGSLPDMPIVEEIFLSGDFDFVPGAFNSNGIDATPNGEWLVIVNSQAGELYRVDLLSGYAQLIDLGGESLSNGDGILIDGKTIYVVRNRLNQIAVVEVNSDFSSGEVVRTIMDPAFRVPTTIAEFGDRLYAVNARFDTPPEPDTDYEVVSVEK